MAAPAGSMTPGPVMADTLWFADTDTLTDLATLVGRAHRADPGGAARLIGHGDVLAVYVSPVHGGGGPVVLGLRTLGLAAPSGLDVTVPLEALEAALRAADVARLTVPSGRASAGGWAGTSPPRRGWQAAGAVGATVLARRAAEGIAEVATGVPAGSGASAVAALRARVWGRPLLAELPQLPAGVAFAVTVLGFTDGRASAEIYRSGPWWRLTTAAGHVLARRSALLQS